MTGTVYGLGVGPGDPELITVKALKLLRCVPVVAYPAPEHGASFARAIVARWLSPAQTEIAIRVPMETARRALEVLKYLGELAKIANQNAFSDIATGGLMALAATKGACYNVGINLSMLPEEEAAEKRSEIRKLMEEASSIANEIESSMIGRM